MVELLRTNDPVLISFVTVYLADNGVEAVTLDSHMSVVEGSLGVLPRRVMVADEAAARARRLLAEADIETSPAAERGSWFGG